MTGLILFNKTKSEYLDIIHIDGDLVPGDTIKNLQPGQNQVIFTTQSPPPYNWDPFRDELQIREILPKTEIDYKIELLFKDLINA